MASSDYNLMTAKMEKTVSAFKEHLSTIRAGRANPAVLDKITVEYYGSPVNISQVANISVPEARMIMIQPWEAKIIHEIEKAIQKSDLGINPSNDGKALRLVFPPLTEERRKELIKQVKAASEDVKVVLRNARRDMLDDLKEQKKKSIITEDDLKNAEKDIQKILDKYIAEIDKISANKNTEIMDI